MAKKVPNKIKDDIINYSLYIYEEIIDKKKDLTDYSVPHVYFLEIIYQHCIMSWHHSKNYQLYESKIREIVSDLIEGEITFSRFKNKEIELIGVTSENLLHFNHDPSVPVKYDKKTQTWITKDKK